MTRHEAPKRRKLDGLRQLLFGETPQAPTSTPARPARHERWQVERWNKLLATRTPRQAAAEGPDPKYTVERPISLSDACIEGNTATFVVVVDNPAFTPDLSMDGDWIASVFPVKRPVSGTTSLGRILCRPGTDKTAAIEDADAWVHTNFPTVLERDQRPFVETTNPDPSELDAAGEKHGALIIYRVPIA